MGFGLRLPRNLALPLAGIALGVLVAGFGLFRRTPHALNVVPPGYVALVNQKGILTSDFIAQTTTEIGKPFEQTNAAERERVLHNMIDEELLVQRGLVLDLPETTVEVREAMGAGVNAQVAAPLLAQEPTDAELRTYYDTHRAKYTAEGSMSVRNLVLRVGGYQNADQSTAQAQTDAAEAVYQLRAGASVDYILEHFGFVDVHREADIEPDFAAKLHLGDSLYTVAATLAEGEISDPQIASDGVHVLLMERRHPPGVVDFTAVRNDVYTDYRQMLTRQATQENLRLLRRQAQILIAPVRPDGSPQPDTAPQPDTPMRPAAEAQP